SFADFLGSADRFVALWLDLPDDAARAAFAAAAGPDARARSYPDYRADVYYVHPGYILLGLFSTVILAASALNLVRLMLAKFMARADQTGIQRALGASRRWIAAQHVVEAKLVGLLGGVLGLGFGAVEIALLNALVPDRIGDATVDGT